MKSVTSSMLLLICLGIWLISASGQTDAEPNFGARGAAWPILRLVQVSTRLHQFSTSEICLRIKNR